MRRSHAGPRRASAFQAPQVQVPSEKLNSPSRAVARTIAWEAPDYLFAKRGVSSGATPAEAPGAHCVGVAAPAIWSRFLAGMGLAAKVGSRRQIVSARELSRSSGKGQFVNMCHGSLELARSDPWLIRDQGGRSCGWVVSRSIKRIYRSDKKICGMLRTAPPAAAKSRSEADARLAVTN